MTREEAKKMALSRDCHCIKGKDRDNNYAECIDKIFDWHESEVKKLTIHYLSNSLDLRELERRLDEALEKETRETLTEWLKQQRQCLLTQR